MKEDDKKFLWRENINRNSDDSQYFDDHNKRKNGVYYVNVSKRCGKFQNDIDYYGHVLD